MTLTTSTTRLPPRSLSRSIITRPPMFLCPSTGSSVLTQVIRPTLTSLFPPIAEVSLPILYSPSGAIFSSTRTRLKVSTMRSRVKHRRAPFALSGTFPGMETRTSITTSSWSSKRRVPISSRTSILRLWIRVSRVPLVHRDQTVSQRIFHLAHTDWND